MTSPGFEARVELVRRSAHGRCECIELGHGHSIERCVRPGTRVQHRGDRTDDRFPNLMWICVECSPVSGAETEIIDFGDVPRTEKIPLPAPDTVPTRLPYILLTPERGGTDDRSEETRLQGQHRGFDQVVPGRLEPGNPPGRGRHCRA